MVIESTYYVEFCKGNSTKIGGMNNSFDSKTVFARRLKAARKTTKIPQDKLGVMIGLDEGCSSARMSRYESGIHWPDYETVKKIATVLNLPTEYFYCEDDRLAELLIVYQKISSANKDKLFCYISQLCRQPADYT